MSTIHCIVPILHRPSFLNALIYRCFIKLIKIINTIKTIKELRSEPVYYLYFSIDMQLEVNEFILNENVVINLYGTSYRKQMLRK